MDETSQVVDVLDTLVASVTNPVSVSVSDTARNGLDKLRGALEVKDIDTLVGPDRPDVLSKPPPGMTDPEDLKYFDLYRQSFTKEHIQMPGSQRMQNASKAHGTGFRVAVKRAINAARFITSTRSVAQSAELGEEMERVLNWESFNVNRVAILSDRQPLLLVGLTALNHFGLLQTFGIEQQTAVNFLRAVEHHYMPNPYHNSTHAADVTQALLAIVYQDGLHTKFTDLELLACFIAAIIHDVVHPGFSNPFLTKTQDEQALMYNDQSANEALSLSVGFKILQSPECNLFKKMSREDYFYARKLITGIVLATDMAVHSQVVESARAVLHGVTAESEVWNPQKAENRLLAMKTIMHVADISNASRPPWLAGMWTRAVYEEFFRQGDAEKEMGLDISPLSDRDTVAIAESQKAFLNFVVTPTWDLLKDIAPKSHSLAKSIIARNFTRWAALAEHGDPTAVLHDNDPHMPSGRVHISPIQSPFHSNNQTSWGNADMLLLLLNDENNEIVGEGLRMISHARRGDVEKREPSPVSTHIS